MALVPRGFQLLEVLLDDAEAGAGAALRKPLPEHGEARLGLVVPLQVDQAADQPVLGSFFFDTLAGRMGKSRITLRVL